MRIIMLWFSVLVLGIFLVACTNTGIEDNPDKVLPDVDQEDTDKDSPVQLEDEEDDTNKDEQANQNDEGDARETYTFENDGFKIITPAANTVVRDEVIVKGKTSAFEGNVMYTLEDGHFIFDEGHVTATEGGVEWRDFEITFDTSDLETGLYHIVVYEESAKDGSIINEIMIPIEVK